MDMNILIIEDDKEVSETLRQGLNELGFSTDIANDGLSGLDLAQRGNYDVLIIDRMLPGLDGLAIIKQLRKKSIQTPILMLTALAEVDDRVEGLEAGADDYLGKPFAFAELVARLRALFKRSVNNPTRHQLTVGDLLLDKVKRKVTRGDKALHLKPREFELLLYFCEHKDEVVTREMLLKEVWGLEFDPQTNIVDVHISRLRRQLDKDFRDPLLRTVRGQGYVFGPE